MACQVQDKAIEDVLELLIVDYFPSPHNQHQLDPEYEGSSPNPENAKVKIFKHLQKYQSVGLVIPVDEEFIYFAAMNSKSCRLTTFGY